MDPKLNEIARAIHEIEKKYEVEKMQRFFTLIKNGEFENEEWLARQFEIFFEMKIER